MKTIDKKVPIIISIIAVILTSIVFLLPDFDYVDDGVCYSYLNGEANKVILFIGDGMGENHINAAEVKLEKEMYFTSFEKQGYVSTNSLTKFAATDSAAAGTALATGVKVSNGEIAYHNGRKITSISEKVKSRNMGVGVITTDKLCGATPSAFSGHANDRNNVEQIINTQLTSNIDLLFGKGVSEYSSYENDFVNQDYTYIDTCSELVPYDSKVIGVFKNINNYESEENKPTLPMLMDYAIDYFEEKYPQGYFIMVEGAYIDKESHSNDISDMIEHLDQLDDTIELAHNRLKNEACFIVTSDHETGDLSYTNNKEEVVDELFKKTGHTSKDVKYFIDYNRESIKNIGYKIDNTHIHKICDALLTINN